MLPEVGQKRAGHETVLAVGSLDDPQGSRRNAPYTPPCAFMTRTGESLPLHSLQLLFVSRVRSGALQN